MSISNQTRFEVGKTYTNICDDELDLEQGLTCTVTKITKCFIEVTGDVCGKFKLHTGPDYQCFNLNRNPRGLMNLVLSTQEVSE